jgi:hypothetical protein
MSSKRKNTNVERNKALIYIRQSVVKNEADKVGPARQRALARQRAQQEGGKKSGLKMPMGTSRRGLSRIAPAGLNFSSVYLIPM